MRQISVDYQEAQRAEAEEAWALAASAYLKALTLEPQRCADAVLDLERLTQRSASLKVRVIWGIALVSQARWEEADEALAPLPNAPLNLSKTITQRWSQLKQRRSKDGSDLSTWVRSLRLLDRVLSMGFAQEAIRLADYAVHQITSPEKSALVLYEAGRIGILHKEVSLGVVMMRRAIEVKEILRDRARKLVDEALTEQRAEGEELEELLELRINRVQDLEAWASELIQSTPLSARVTLAARFAMHTELGLRRPDVAIYFYTEALIASYLTQDGRTAPEITEAAQHSLEALVRLGISGSTDAERGLHAIRARTQVITPLEVYLKTLSLDTQQNSARRGNAAHELAQLYSKEGLFTESGDTIKLAVQLSPELVDLRSLIKRARRAQAWEPLDRLLSLQLNLTRSVKKQQAILIAQAQTRRARHLDAAAYLALVGAQSLGEAPKADELLTDLLHDEGARAQVTTWLLRPGASEHSGWSSDILHFVEVYHCFGPPAVCIPEEQKPQPSLTHEPTEEPPDGSTADEDAGLFTFDFKDEALDESGDPKEQQERATLVSSGDQRDPLGALLSAALNQAPQEWPLASALLAHLEAQGQWEDWVEWVMTSPKGRWPVEERESLVHRAVELSRKYKTSQLSKLLRDIAESLDRSGASLQERSEAWGAYLDEHPADRHALEVFTELARSTESWATLATRYEAALAVRQTGKIHLLELLAELYEERLHDPERASVCWSQLLSIKPSHERAGLWLSLYLSSLQRWRELLALCTEQWRPSESELNTWRESLLQAQIGLEHIEEAMQSWEHLSERRTQQLYVPSLLALAEKTSHGPAILTLLDADLDLGQTEGDPQALSELETASQSEEDLMDESLPPGLPSEDELIAYDQSLAGIESVSEHFSREADELKRAIDARPKVPARLRLKARAITYMSPNIDSLSAIHAWRNVRALDARDVEATLALTELYASTGRREELSALLDFAERWCGVDEGMRRALTQGALSYETRFEDYEEAFRCWSVLLERAPQHAERALVALERLAQKERLWSRLDERWVKYAERSPRMSDRSRALLAQTKLCAGPLHHWQIALELLPPLEERRPYCQEVRALYEEVIPPLRRWELLAERWLVWADEMPVGPARAERLARLAELYETRLEQPDRALVCYQLAAQMSAGDRAQSLQGDVGRLSARLTPQPPHSPDPGVLDEPSS